MTGKPQDIPQGVWDAAVAAVTSAPPRGHAIEATEVKGLPWVAESVSRAILAEREASAKVASAAAYDLLKPHFGHGFAADTTHVNLANRIGEAVKMGDYP